MIGVLCDSVFECVVVLGSSVFWSCKISKNVLLI